LGIKEKDLEWWACKKKRVFRGVKMGLGCGGWALGGECAGRGSPTKFDYIG